MVTDKSEHCSVLSYHLSPISYSEAFLHNKLGYNRCMIGRMIPAPRFFIDPAVGASFSERRRRPNVIYSQTAIFLKVVAKIAPPGKFLRVVVDLAKDIDESPLLYILDRVALGFRKVKLVSPRRHAPHVELVRRNIQITD